jgi:hypothetical protein
MAACLRPGGASHGRRPATTTQDSWTRATRRVATGPGGRAGHGEGRRPALGRASRTGRGDDRLWDARRARGSAAAGSGDASHGTVAGPRGAATGDEPRPRQAACLGAAAPAHGMRRPGGTTSLPRRAPASARRWRRPVLLSPPDH